jgi:hypothetical protein
MPGSREKAQGGRRSQNRLELTPDYGALRAQRAVDSLGQRCRVTSLVSGPMRVMQVNSFRSRLSQVAPNSKLLNGRPAG